MLRAIKYYGNITEVVIPTKRDVGGRRFGFARFSRVTDVRGFELKFDNIIIGRDKISVNLARYQRVEGERRFDRNQVRKEGRRSKRDEEQHDKEANERSLVGTLSFPCKEAPYHLPMRSKLENYHVNQAYNPLFCHMRQPRRTWRNYKRRLSG
ncbi:hypothetical protein L195_g047034 [Trifolium pratense]|uniref:RRM domain-containing protein n=1 Tax=Trifolium pratense TaxID=57577 RepID=A0A2K3MJF0_TRIPR|nr:hypothetical protein L195_g047034 [Trifolium pratense]